MGRELSKTVLSECIAGKPAASPAKGTMRAQLIPRAERTRIIWTVVVASVLLAAASVSSKASELHPDTLRSWNEYIRAQNIRIDKSSKAASFLWSDQLPDRIRRLRNGEILVAPVGENPKPVPHGLIHHWIGAAFLPGTTLNDILALVRDYGKYQRFYAPNVVDSRLLQHSGTEDAFSLRMLNKALVTKFALDAEFQTSYARVNETRCYSVGYSTRIREVQEYGQPNQHELPADSGHGFIWRLYNIARFEQRDGGVYVELEAVALSRDVPSALRWLITPVVRRASRDSMLVSLQKTQQAVVASGELASRVDTNDQRRGKRSPASTALPADAKAFVSP